jgi:hypothetical protein
VGLACSASGVQSRRSVEANHEVTKTNERWLWRKWTHQSAASNADKHKLEYFNALALTGLLI